MGVPFTTRTFLSTGPTMNARMWYQSYFVQDNYKVNGKLSLNYGLRWEHRSPLTEVNNRVGILRLAGTAHGNSGYADCGWKLVSLGTCR